MLGATALAAVAALQGCAAQAAPEAGGNVSTPGATAASAIPVGRAVILANPGFESANPGRGGNPEGWAAQQHSGAPAYAFTQDTAVKHTGERSLRIDNLRPEVYGSVLQRVPVAGLAGGKLRLSVWLKTRDVHGNDFGKGATPVLQAMVGGSPAASAPYDTAALAGTSDWVLREVTLAIPQNAEAIEIGVMLTGTGTVWLDDVALMAMPAPP